MKRAKFITISTQKGGAGKTTLTVLLASHLHYLCGYNVAVIDCDFTQPSISNMRTRDLAMIKKDKLYRTMACNLFSKLKKRAYRIERSPLDNAIECAEKLTEEDSDLDYIFFDLPGTISTRGVVNILAVTDYIFTPITADRSVLESSLSYASIINDRVIATSKSAIKGLYMVWNMVDRRERSELYDNYESAIAELGIPIMETRLPDSKRFRREIGSLHRAIFRSTMFPIDRTLIKSSGIPEFTAEFLKITEESNDE
ncbi:MAG: ParA family protein [Rikenellaceae bacterium]